LPPLCGRLVVLLCQSCCICLCRRFAASAGGDSAADRVLSAQGGPSAVTSSCALCKSFRRFECLDCCVRCRARIVRASQRAFNRAECGMFNVAFNAQNSVVRGIVWQALRLMNAITTITVVAIVAVFVFAIVGVQLFGNRSVHWRVVARVLFSRRLFRCRDAASTAASAPQTTARPSISTRSSRRASPYLLCPRANLGRRFTKTCAR
jgi:hypothetical protein